jgi:hypothetical protein
VAGLYVDPRQFWTVDSHHRFVYRHYLPPSLKVLAAYTLSELETNNRSLSCFTWHDGNLWIGQDGSNRLLERPRWRLKRR